MKKSKALVLGIALALSLGGLAAANNASACPWGPRVVVKRCHMTRWGQKCHIHRRGCRGRRYWRQARRRNYGPVYYGPQVRWGWGVRIG